MLSLGLDLWHKPVLGSISALFSRLFHKRPTLGVDATFARDSDATYVDSDGVIQTASSNVARFDYSTGSSALLMEPAATNSATYSETFTGWGVSQGTLTQDQTTAPDGGLAPEYVENAVAATEHGMNFPGVTPVVSTKYALSIYAKKGTGSRFVAFRGLGIGGNYPIFDIENGALIEAGTQWDSASITDAGNGWYRCEATCTAAGTAIWIIYTQAVANFTDYSRDGDGTSSVYFWGAQMEVGGTVVTSYIPTAADAVTRNLEELEYPLTTPDTEGMVIADIAFPGGTGMTVAGGFGVVNFKQGTFKTTMEYSNNTSILQNGDGTGINQISKSRDIDERFYVAANWSTGGDMGLAQSDAGTWGAWDTFSYDGTQNSDANKVYFAYNIKIPIKFYGAYIYDTDQGQNWIEENF
jgi:hypothetical protein